MLSFRSIPPGVLHLFCVMVTMYDDDDDDDDDVDVGDDDMT